jgi:hypothetical protein
MYNHLYSRLIKIGILVRQCKENIFYCKSLFFWDVTQHRLVVIFQYINVWGMVNNYPYTMHNFLEERRSHLHRGGSQKSCIFYHTFNLKDFIKIVWRKPNLMHYLFFVYFVKLYMFRAYLGPSSGGTTICIQRLVLIILARWLSVVLVRLFQSNQDKRIIILVRWLSVVLVGLSDSLSSWLDWVTLCRPGWIGWLSVVLVGLGDCLSSWLDWMTVCRPGWIGWLSVVLVGLEQSNQDVRQSSSKNNKYQLLYTYSCTSWWWA